MTDSEPGESDSQANSMEYEDEEFSYGSEAADFDFDDDAGSAGLLSDRKVPDAILDAVADDSHKARWRKFLLESFVEMQSGLTWCPAPDCGRAAEAMSVPVTAALDVICDCGSKYCFKCKQEAHRPVDCSTVNLWIIRDSKESENMTWILANTKNCPNCKRHIEKNQGCMHMTCSQCRHEFCWLCLGDWRKHNENTGGYYGCNMYQKARQNGELDEREMQREQAKQSLERYMHYWQRWAENDRAKAKALTHLIKFRERQQEPLSEITATPSSQLKFVEDAWKQVIDCRRILKWTYAEGYYKFTKEDGKKEDLAAEQHERFFVFNQVCNSKAWPNVQGQAEHYLERLHHKVEKDLQVFLTVEHSETAVEEWAVFREQLIGLTDVTRSHFTKLVNEMEKGLDLALQSYDTVNPKTGGRGADEASTSAKPTRDARAGPRSDAYDPYRMTMKHPRPRPARNMPSQDEAHAWMCQLCTYANTRMSSQQCQMCGTARTQT
ncbi:hypothetical protein APUTEX25_003767 [Auxenochlorella protothecoides]|uniref:RBR-type E3 ubiquitin transferase n=1 Tax=Auxenochlorella protothecoides TaxID=3075 RepID=A0A3M7L5Z5_AUXPR|nr:hypothetical protein APUTEX25_003767 [Auxenochlorella protothecoides]|eukprot:RMZ57524.1 hypothetical protein APUTEX25_003767 [Auxenochlorella protothecoides]